MSEFVPQPLDTESTSHDNELPYVALAQVVEQYFPEDKEFVMEMDFDDALGFMYGQLLEQGEDPDEVLREMGVTE